MLCIEGWDDNDGIMSSSSMCEDRSKRHSLLVARFRLTYLLSADESNRQGGRHYIRLRGSKGVSNFGGSASRLGSDHHCRLVPELLHAIA